MERIMIAVGCLVAFLSVGTGAPISCPSAEDLAPCTCIRMAYGLHVVCAEFNENEDLIRAMKVLRDYQVQNVLLHGLVLKDVLPSDLFDGLEISELKVEKSKLKFPLPAFSGLDESLHVLNVAQNSLIKSSENFSLARLNKLTQLNIKKNPISMVNNQWLNGKIPNVRSIRLDEDEITEIESRAFASLPLLEFVSISENRIRTIERSVFPKPADALTTIDLSGNEIKSLPKDFFTEMPNLQKVILSGNDLTTLPESTWKTVWQQLDVVLLSENNLICDEKLDWLKKVRWPETVVAHCMSPSKMFGKTLREVYET